MKKTKIQELQTVPVDLDYLNNLYDLFVNKKETNEFKEALIALCNMVVQKFTDKNPTYKYLKDELFSEAYFKAVKYSSAKSEKDFDTPNVFNSYMIKSLYLSLTTYCNSKERILDDQEIELEEQEVQDYDIRESISYQIKEKKILKTFENLIKTYPDRERRLFLYFLGIFLKKDEISKEAENLIYLAAEFNLKREKILTYIKLFNTLINICLMINLTEDFSLNPVGLKKQGDKKLLDKFFLTIASLDRFPFTLEMYEILGDKFIDFLKIFGGNMIRIPTVEQVKKADMFVEIFLQSYEDEDNKALLKKLSQKYKVSVSDIKYHNNYIKNKFEKLIKDDK